MSDFVPNNRHMREVLIFFFHSKKTAAEAHRELQKVYGDAALSETTCRDWFRRFKDDDFDVDDQVGVIYYELLKPNETITGERYRLQLMRLSRALCEKRPQYAERHEKVILQHDNARPHVAKPVKTYLQTLKWEVALPERWEKAVCDHTRYFTHIYVGNVGSVHNSRVFRLSSLQEYINNPMKFPNNTHLIGDAAYALHKHLLVPYPDNGHLTQYQKNYNLCHSSTRMVIERAFALLKGRWRSLLHVLVVNCVDFAPYHILACCVLHNICLLQKDELENVRNIQTEVEEAELFRDGIIEYNDRNVVTAKRNNICANLLMINT
ncbi:uncharacterized protein [Mycetomoellerius zeteki]|uniref:uncharacterized protein n=1 Tax=Mycetomoellerius zeteki TaxID=64791 RepID=UPI00084EB848|nr:PREDICTED: uncharacterized protein LOC108724993 [Trachymyrmex zeteki]